MKKTTLYSIYIVIILMITYYIREKLNFKTKTISLSNNISVKQIETFQTTSGEPEDNTPISTLEDTDTQEYDIGDYVYYYRIGKDTGGITQKNAVDTMNKFYGYSKAYFKPNIDIEYNVSFYFKKGEDTKKVKTIICCMDSINNDKILWSLKYLDDTFYIKFGLTPDKNSETLTIESTPDEPNKLYSIYVSFKKNKLFCYIDSDSKTIDINDSTDDPIAPNNSHIIMFNSESKQILEKPRECFGENPESDDCKHSMSISNILLGDKFITEKDINYTAVCKYDPSNDTNQNICKERCIKTKDCAANVCNSICNTISKIIKEPTSDDPEPEPPKKIRVTGVDKGFKIEFKKPEFQGFKSKIDKFIIIVKALYVDGDDTENSTKIYNFAASDNINCEYDIKGLVNDKFYNISVFSHNDKGFMSLQPSDIETEQPKGKTMEAHPALLETENQIQKIIDSESEDKNFNNPCFGDESKKYRFSSSILDSEKVNNMYKFGGSNFDNIFLNKINPNMETVLLDLEKIDNQNNNTSNNSDSVKVMKDFDEDFNFF